MTGRLLRWIRRLVRRLVFLALLALVVLLGWVWFANPYEERPNATCGVRRPPVGIEELEATAPGYRLPESSTYLTLPKWYVVYNSAEYARALAAGPPSGFPYFRSVAQYWRSYYRVFKVTQAKYRFSAGDHVTPIGLGLSFTVEDTLKGVYESTIGRLTEWAAGSTSEEDKYAAKIAAEHAKFLHAAPFYDFPYGRALTGLWRQTPFRGVNQLRKLERRAILSVEYGAKAVYGWLIRAAKTMIDGEVADRVYVWVANVPASRSLDKRVRQVSQPTRGSHLLSVPRDAAFTEVVPALARQGVTFLEIAGNDEIFLTALAPANWSGVNASRVVLSEPVLTEPGRIRIGLAVPVDCLGRVLADLQSSGATLEHLYNY